MASMLAYREKYAPKLAPVLALVQTSAEKYGIAFDLEVRDSRDKALTIARCDRGRWSMGWVYSILVGPGRDGAVTDIAILELQMMGVSITRDLTLSRWEDEMTQENAERIIDLMMQLFVALTRTSPASD